MDKATRNQKVFVALSAVLELQSQYHRAVQDLKTLPESTEEWIRSLRRQRVNAYEQVIRTLELPIPIGVIK